MHQRKLLSLPYFAVRMLNLTNITWVIEAFEYNKLSINQAHQVLLLRIGRRKIIPFLRNSSGVVLKISISSAKDLLKVVHPFIVDHGISILLALHSGTFLVIICSSTAHRSLLPSCLCNCR